jgi:hypothetical protein
MPWPRPDTHTIELPANIVKFFVYPKRILQKKTVKPSTSCQLLSRVAKAGELRPGLDEISLITVEKRFKEPRLRRLFTISLSCSYEIHG